MLFVCRVLVSCLASSWTNLTDLTFPGWWALRFCPKILISFPCVLTDVQQESDFDFDLLEIDINCKKVS